MDNRIPRYYPSVPDNSIPNQLVGCYARGSRPSYQEPRLNQEPQGQWARIASAAPSARIQFARRRVRRATDLQSESLRSHSGSPWSKFHTTDKASHPSKNLPNSPESPLNSVKISATSSSIDVQKDRSSRTPPRQAKVRRLHRGVPGPHPLSTEDSSEEVFHRLSSDGAPLAASTVPVMSSAVGNRIPLAPQPVIGTPSSNSFFLDNTRLVRDTHPTLGGYLMPQASHSSISAGEYSAKSLVSSREDHHSGSNGRSSSSTIPSGSLRAKRSGNDSKLVFQSSQVIDSDPSRTFSYFDDKSMRQRPFTKGAQNFSIKEFTSSTVDSAFTQSFPQGYEHTNISGAVNLGVSKDFSGNPLVTEPEEFQHMKDQMQGFHGSDYHKHSDFIKPNIHTTFTSTSALKFPQNFSSHPSDSANQHASHKFISKDSSFGSSYKVSYNLPSDFDLAAARSGVSNPYDHTNVLPPMHSFSDDAFESSQLLHYQIGPSSMSNPESPQVELYDVASHNEQLNRPSPNTINAHSPVSYDTTNLGIPNTFPLQVLCNSRATICESDMTKAKVSTEKPDSMKTKSPKVQKADSSVPGYSHHIRKSPGILHDSSSCTGYQTLRAVPSTSTTSSDFLSSSHDVGSLSQRRKSKGRKAKNLESTKGIHHVTRKCSQVTPISLKYMDTRHSAHFPVPEYQAKINSEGTSAEHQKDCSQVMQDGASGKDFMSSTDQRPNQFPHTNDETSKSVSSAGGTRRRRRHAVGLICGVCGDSARSLHFGGVSCDSCKAFFRRAVIARAYPSFLCVTTGIPPSIKCQKSVTSGNKDEQYSGNDRETRKYSKDSSQIDSCSVPVQNEMQLGPNLGTSPLISKSVSKIDGDCEQRCHQGSSICSIPSPVPTEVVRSQSGKTHLSLSAPKSGVFVREAVSSSRNADLCVKSGSFDNAVSKNNSDSLGNKEVASRSVSQRLLKCPPITIANRKYCQACRFQRCIDIGMEVGWVALENDAPRKISSQGVKGDAPGKGSDDCSDSHQPSVEYKTKDDVSLKDEKCKEKKENGPLDVDDYLTKEEQKQIEELVDIYRSVFWGVPEPAYYRPALIDFPPPFDTNVAIESVKQAQKNIASQSSNESKIVDGCSASDTVLNSGPQQSLVTSKFSSMTRKQHSSSCKDPQNEDFQASPRKTQDCANNGKQSTEDHHHESLGQTHEQWENQHSSSDGELASHPSLCGELNVNELSDWQSSMDEKENFNPGASIEEILGLPEDPLGVNMLRNALRRRPRPWLIRQLMGYTLRFLYVVLKLLQRVGRDMSMADRTILLRQGMTGLTFLNSVYTYDSSVEGWPERVFPPLPLVLQEGNPGSSSDQPDYLKGTPMHADEVASVVAPQVLEHQLTFIRGMKTLVGNDCTTMFLLMAIMLFDPTHEGLEQPQTVEDIQGKYCYLLRQYVSWKFKNGPPMNPGIERPSNFTPLTYLLQRTNQPASLRREGEEVNDSKAEEIKNAPQSAEAKTGMPLSNPRETAQVNDETKINNKDPIDSHIFQFKIPEGMYFSPPYPPSLIDPSSIFPVLLTRMADLKQIAHSYSSIPFLLQGSEVDEIASLVARIEVFMSDIIAMEPDPDFRDRGGSGGGSGAGGGNETQNDDEFKHCQAHPKENFSNNDGENDVNTKQIGDQDSLWKNVLLESCNLKWSEQHMEWDCCSTGGESNTESSLSTMSIGDSFDGIIESLEAGEGEEMENRVACSSEEVFESLYNWDKGHSMRLVDTDQLNITSQEKLGQVSGVEAKPPLVYLQNYCPSSERSSNTENFDEGNAGELGLSKIDLTFKKHKELESLSLFSGPTNPKSDRNMPKGDRNLGPQFPDTSHHGIMDIENWKRECQIACANNVTEFPFHDGSDLVSGKSLCENERHLMEEYSLQPWQSNTTQLSSKAKISPIHRKDVLSDGSMERKSFQVPLLSKADSNVWQNKEPSQLTQQQSLWDRIKETGKALLGLDSTQNRYQDSSFLWKGVYSNVEGKVLPEDKRDVDNLMNPFERPDSNSSGYGSNVSSPPLPSVQKDLDAYNYGDDWEEFFQKL